MNQLEDLNFQQQQAVTAGTGPILILAGPGSGKTRVLTHRIAYLIGSLGVQPYHILAVTFTNKAAREMEKRVEDLLGRDTRGLTLGTFHATCAKLLRRESVHLPFDANYVIFDADDQVRVVKRIIKDMELDDKVYRAIAVHASISRAKNELIMADDFIVATYRDEVIKRIYQRYQQTLIASNALDFDDLLLWTAILLEENPAVRQKYARRYEHVLVDEFQDTNTAQYNLLKHLASFHENIFVVGDADQSIYRWRGADYRNVLRFEKDFPAAQVILLEQNYRSTQHILDTAMAVIDHNLNRTQKQLFTDRGTGLKPVMRELYDDREEAAFIVEKVLDLVEGQRQVQYGDCAIMYRINAQSRVLEEAFLANKIPYKLVGAQRFYGRREIKDIVAYLRLVHNPRDEVSLQRVINTPTRGIGDKTYADLHTHTTRVHLPAGELLLDLGKGKNSQHLEALNSRAGSVLSRFGEMLAAWVDLRQNVNPLTLMDRILEDVRYRIYIDDGTDEGRDRWENVMELRRLAGEYRDRTLTEFLENIALVSDQDTIDPEANAATLLTLHAAKGLEFPVVFIVGLNEGTLPHFRSFEEAEEMQEECRLLYVGVTRAMDRLYLLHTLNRYSYGYSEPAAPSRFLDGIPQSLLDDDRPAVPSRQAYQATEWDSNANPPPFREQTYQPGMKVGHDLWGEGLVLKSVLEEDDEIVDIFFESVGLKRVAASIAKLEVMG